jgi:hypothetical protein
MSVGADVAALEGMGEQMFVINLCAAMAPINLDSQNLSGLDRYKLYQVSRIEDGRRRYRLRLGFFNTEADAEDVLSSVRNRFATAFTSCLCEEDLKHATGYLKCSVQDLQRTGRYAIPKFKNTGATTSVKALDASAIRKLQAAEASRVAAARDLDDVVEVDWQPQAARPAAPAPAKPAVKSAPPVSAKPAPVKPQQPLPAAMQTQTLAALVGAAKPTRESLMRRAHAMADVDAAERAKALPQSPPSVDVAATGKFKLPATPAPAAKPPAVKPNSATPVAAAAPAPRVELKASTPPRQSTAAPSPHQKNQPFHVGAGVEIPETSLSLAPAESAAPAKPHQTATQVAPIMPPVMDNSISPDLMRARELAKQSAQWRQDNGEVPTLDTTQTIRTLTKKELEDANLPKWFAVQLAISDHPANLDTMPRLDIFEAYSLYSVAAMDNGGIRHALRLGFFREEVSAEAVTGYLKTFFPEPVIVRIPDAEHDRFINAPKLSAIKPPASIVTMEQKRPAADAVPTVNTAVERTPPKVAPRIAPPATKRAAHTATQAKKPGRTAKPTTRTAQQDMLEEARLLGLSDTQMIRVQKNPSLLSRLVGKLSK